MPLPADSVSCRRVCLVDRDGIQLQQQQRRPVRPNMAGIHLSNAQRRDRVIKCSLSLLIYMSVSLIVLPP